MPVEQESETNAVENEIEAWRRHHGHHGHDGDEVTPEERHAAIAVMAYEIWEKRGEGAGHAVSDWLEAEKEYDAAHPDCDR